MTTFLISVLFIECLAIFWWGLSRRDRLIQFPFFVAGVFSGWLLPQLIGLSGWSDLPPYALEKTLLMAIFSLAACFFGYVYNKRPAKLFNWHLSRRRLLWASVLFSLLGSFFFLKVGLLAEEAVADFGGQWTGEITIYVFFSRMLTIGLVVALIVHFNQPSRLTLMIIAFDLLFFVHRIFILGRRAAMVELFLILLMALWFNRRWLPSRRLLIGAVLLGTLVINSIGDYRYVMLGEGGAKWSGAGISDILEIDYFGNLKRIIDGEARNDELLNATLTIEALDRNKNFDYGLSLWNAVVHNYVPGQLIGHEMKQSMMMDLGNVLEREFGHQKHTGTTLTGLADAFSSFWFFGAVKFFLIGLIMSRWYRAAVAGNLIAQMIIMLTVTESLLAITHSTHSFFNTFIWLAAFLLPAVVFARVKMHKEQGLTLK